ncbi:MAG: F0F1 ATP synthase subunit epsilon [Phycisphaerae bacterium]|nr:F0F1 ATP synthase subunit epsilon [Phycisphaerae bacterium]
MATAFRCSIVTPSEAVLSADATYVTFEAWDGQRGVMSGASPFLTTLGVGSARVDLADGTSASYLVDIGFAQMQGSELTLLSDFAADVNTLSRAAAEREYAEARATAVEPGHTSALERERVERMQKLAAAKIALAVR